MNMAERGENSLIVVSGGVTAVTNSVIAGILDEAGKGEFIADIYGASHGLAGLVEGKVVDLGAQKRKTIEGLRRTPGSVLSGRVSEIDEAAPLLEVLGRHEIGTVFVIGSLSMVNLMVDLAEAAQDAGFPLQVLGIPTSAENEVEGGDHTPGYGSAARFVAGAARDCGRAGDAGDAPVVVLEVPGAASGWLAAATALARDKDAGSGIARENSAPHVIVLPERPADIEALVDEARRAYQKHGFAVVTTTESSTASDGTPLDGQALSALLSEQIGVATRYDRPGSLALASQSSIARSDSDEAYNLGSLAVRLSGDDCTGYLVTIQRDQHTADKGEKGYRALEATARLDQVTPEPRPLPDEFIAENGLHVSAAFLDWARPLIGGALPEYTSLT
jgi:6-phosphofructokinase